MQIFLTGFRSCSKTTLATLLAQHFKFPFFDTDHWIEEKHKQTVVCLAKGKGETFFRKEEEKAVAAAKLSSSKVIATGAGCLLQPQCLQMAKQGGKILYLQMPKELLLQRFLQKPLPTFYNDPSFFRCFEDLYQKRIPLYEKICDDVVVLTGALQKDFQALCSFVDKFYG